MIADEAAVFVNCPFDDDYRPMFEAIVFAVHDCGFRPRCALEASDGGQVRIEKITALIEACRWGIHDISRTELNEAGLPRFNMPFELGLFLGARRFGDRRQRRKTCLVLDRDRFRYQKYLSDIAGQDIDAHQGQPSLAIAAVRNWLMPYASGRSIPGGAEITRRYEQFTRALSLLLHIKRLSRDEMTFMDYSGIIAAWLSAGEPIDGP